jgi:hypothetical protein
VCRHRSKRERASSRVGSRELLPRPLQFAQVCRKLTTAVGTCSDSPCMTPSVSRFPDQCGPVEAGHSYISLPLRDGTSRVYCSG